MHKIYGARNNSKAKVYRRLVFVAKEYKAKAVSVDANIKYLHFCQGRTPNNLPEHAQMFFFSDNKFYQQRET